MALIKDHIPNITSQRRWNEMFPVAEENAAQYWADIYKSPYQAARDTKLQAFQFRVIHRFLPCNKFLHNIHIRRDDNCNTCQQPDSIEHFLYLCPTVKAFWDNVVAWFDREADLQLSVSLRAFLFGVTPGVPQAKTINFLLLFTKFYVYRQKLYHQGSLSLIHLLGELRRRLQVERHLTLLEGKANGFRRWQRIYDALG